MRESSSGVRGSTKDRFFVVFLCPTLHQLLNKCGQHKSSGCTIKNIRVLQHRRHGHRRGRRAPEDDLDGDTKAPEGNLDGDPRSQAAMTRRPSAISTAFQVRRDARVELSTARARRRVGPLRWRDRRPPLPQLGDKRWGYASTRKGTCSTVWGIFQKSLNGTQKFKLARVRV